MTLTRASRTLWLTGLAALGLALATPALGQQRGNTGGQNRTGGSSSSGSSSTRQYPNNSAVGDAVVSIDPDGRRLIVITDDETSQFVSQVITNLDRPKPQVLIKVVFMEITHNNSSDLGVEGTWKKGINSTTTAAVSNLFGLTPGLPGGSMPVPPGGGLYQMIGENYQVTLRALAQAGKLEILSRPSILARNSQPATITVGQSVPLITNVRYDTLGQAVNSVSYQSVGIILRVTPFITSDRMVEMIINPEISELADKSQWVPIATSTSGGSVSAPVINSRSADTVVVTPDGQAVVIGGLMQTTKNDSESKVPLLGDIPGLGAAFRHKIKSSAKTELIILLTPHIVPAPSQLAALSEQERHTMEFLPRSFKDDEVDRFINGLPTKPAGAGEKTPPPATKKSGKGT